jgi:hypothetical protein
VFKVGKATFTYGQFVSVILLCGINRWPAGSNIATLRLTSQPARVPGCRLPHPSRRATGSPDR